ncbi:hypothetical protein JL720_5329 [Aureococcus anophagefferens]|nr:hypothetical protein JL720_5329 [Aureococcus anophagefferens]
MDLAAANQLLCDELYDAALVAYGSAIDGDDKCAAAYAGRAAIYLRLEKYTNALQDANAALAEDGACEPALYRKGLACFHLDEFETALDSFQKGLKLLGRGRRGRGDAQVRDVGAQVRGGDRGRGQRQRGGGGGGRADRPRGAHRDRARGRGGVKVVPCDVKYQYYQTNSHLTITLLAKNVKEEDAEIVITETTLICKLKRDGGKSEMTVISGAGQESLSSAAVYDPVVPAECKVKYFSTKIDVKLKKKDAFNWNELLKGDLIGEPKKKPPTFKPAPASTTSTATPYAGKRDWHQLEKEMEAELEKDKPEGEEALNKLFQDIYGKATPETRAR